MIVEVEVACVVVLPDRPKSGDGSAAIVTNEMRVLLRVVPLIQPMMAHGMVHGAKALFRHWDKMRCYTLRGTPHLILRLLLLLTSWPI